MFGNNPQIYDAIHYFFPVPLPTAGMRSDLTGHHDQIVDYCTEPAAFDFPFLPWRSASDGSLPDHPEYVVGYQPQFKDNVLLCAQCNLSIIIHGRILLI